MIMQTTLIAIGSAVFFAVIIYVVLKAAAGQAARNKGFKEAVREGLTPTAFKEWAEKNLFTYTPIAAGPAQIAQEMRFRARPGLTTTSPTSIQGSFTIEPSRFSGGVKKGSLLKGVVNIMNDTAELMGWRPLSYALIKHHNGLFELLGNHEGVRVIVDGRVIARIKDETIFSADGEVRGRVIKEEGSVTTNDGVRETIGRVEFSGRVAAHLVKQRFMKLDDDRRYVGVRGLDREEALILLALGSLELLTTKLLGMSNRRMF